MGFGVVGSRKFGGLGIRAEALALEGLGLRVSVLVAALRSQVEGLGLRA